MFLIHKDYELEFKIYFFLYSYRKQSIWNLCERTVGCIPFENLAILIIVYK